MENYTAEEERKGAVRARRMMTWLMIFAIVMFFAGLTSAYVVSMSGGYWTRIKMPGAFLWSTAFVLAGSLTLHLSLMSVRKGRGKQVLPFLLATFALGIAFTVSQFQGWGDLVDRGITFSPNKLHQLGGVYGVDYSITKDGAELVLADGQWYKPDDSALERPLNAEIEEQRDRTGPYLYALTLLHLGHLFFGLLAVLVMMVKAARGFYTVGDNVGLWAGATYWHFLGGLWIYLLLFLLFVH
ncbi:MAG: hypothetical protein KA941_04980 [Flavobacteriales bacterium]|nr:hypothetical protein [Flavobacteriales bacterium]